MLSRREKLRRAHARATAEAERYRRQEAYRLTDRERQTLVLASLGATYAESAEQLGISSETVKAHLRGARWLLDAATTDEAVAKAIRAGQIPGRRATDYPAARLAG